MTPLKSVWNHFQTKYNLTDAQYEYVSKVLNNNTVMNPNMKPMIKEIIIEQLTKDLDRD